MSPSKISRVCDVIRGKKVEEALAMLNNMPHSSAVTLKKLITSAAANGEHNLGLAKSELIVAEIYAGPGPILKRMLPRAKGSGASIFKRTSHIYVTLDVINK